MQYSAAAANAQFSINCPLNQQSVQMLLCFTIINHKSCMKWLDTACASTLVTHIVVSGDF